jgi:hypothetical protein
MASLQRVSIPCAVLERGFWLYVCEIETAEGHTLLYIGRTGDSSSANASSPLNRIGQHLGFNKNSNALRRQLKHLNIAPESCLRIEMTAYGPLFSEKSGTDEHNPLRDKVAALEKALCDSLGRAGYTVLNCVNCRKRLDESLWQKVREVFAERFPELNSR